jgi:hypothetical protein
MTTHDYRAALEEWDGLGYSLSAEVQSAIEAALRLAVARQEAEEAVERGEAVRVSADGVFASNGGYVIHGWTDFDDSPLSQAHADVRRMGRHCGEFVLSAIVPLPRPQEIEAEVEQAAK